MKDIVVFSGSAHQSLATEICDHLGIAQRTVEFHRANIFDKLGVASAVELAHRMGRLIADD